MKVELVLIEKMSTLLSELYDLTENLDQLIKNVEVKNDVIENATYYGEVVLPKMKELRKVADELEQNCSKEYWPFPSYGDLLYSVSV